MKHFNFNLSLLSVTLASLSLVGCIDNKYDLSDIDSTVRVTVKDLEVPVNLDAIELSSIFDLDDESVIQNMNGTYAVLVDGDFSSDAIEVKKVDLGTPRISPVNAQIRHSGLSVDYPGLPTGYVPVAFSIPDLSTPFEFSTSNVDKSIRSIEKATADWSITVNLSFTDASGVLKNMRVKDLTLQLPHGLVTPDYANNDGVINLGDRDLNNGTLREVIKVSALDFTSLNPEEFTFVASDGNGTISYKGNIGVKSGILIGGVSTNVNHPEQVKMVLDPKLTRIMIDSFTGDLEYSINNFDVSSVELNDLPDVLTQNGTDIKITNPQLYLAINNPLAGYSVAAHSGLTLTSVRPGSQTSYSLPAGKEIYIGYNKGPAGPYNICLSPTQPQEYYQGYAGSLHVPFPGLSNVLSGQGLPDKINVDFNNARIGKAHVTDFRLGVTLPKVAGNYSFYAPLAFEQGSQVVYSDSDNGWKDDTIDKLTIEALGVTADVENDLPFDIILSGYPLDEHGNQCVDPVTHKPVSLNEVTVRGGQKCKISLKTDGIVNGLDGIHYSARAVVDQGGQTLRPTNKIYLTNIRAIVSGYYEDEL